MSLSCLSCRSFFGERSTTTHGDVNEAQVWLMCLSKESVIVRFEGSPEFKEFWSLLESESPRCRTIVVAAYFDEKLETGRSAWPAERIV